MTKLPKAKVALTALVVVLVSAPIERSVAQTLGPTSPNDLVRVQTASTNCSSGFTGARRVDAQLRTNSNPKTFSIPQGKLFIITNVEFVLLGNAGQNSEMRLGVPCGPGCMRPLVDAMVLTDANGQGGTHVSLGNGFAIQSGIQICVADINHGSPNAFATIQGYFTPAP